MTPPRWYVAFWSAIFAGYCAFWIGINMADTVVLNTQAGTSGKTLATLEGTSQSVTGGLVPASDSAIVGWIRRKTVTLTNAQIKALPTTAVTVIAAPSAGYWNRPIAFSFQSDTTAGAYANINSAWSVLVLQSGGSYVSVPVLNDNTASPALTRLTDFLGVTGPLVIPGQGYLESSNGWVIPNTTINVAAISGAAVELFCDNNGSGDFTGGNAANTLKVTVYYIVEPL